MCQSLTLKVQFCPSDPYSQFEAHKFLSPSFSIFPRTTQLCPYIICCTTWTPSPLKHSQSTFETITIHLVILHKEKYLRVKFGKVLAILILDVKIFSILLQRLLIQHFHNYIHWFLCWWLFGRLILLIHLPLSLEVLVRTHFLSKLKSLIHLRLLRALHLRHFLPG